MLKKFFFTAMICMVLGCVLQGQRTMIDFNGGWLFQKGDVSQGYAAEFDDSLWQTVRLPHDWAIEGPFDPKGDADTGKLPWKGQGWYRRHFTLDAADKGKKVFLVFDGVMAFPKVWINGRLAGQWDYGYNSFVIDATEFVNFEKENIIAVSADTRLHGSRWYPGAGIYRKVRMILTDTVHIPVWGTYITTPAVKDNRADVHIRTEVANQGIGTESVSIETEIVSPKGSRVAQKTREVQIEPGKNCIFDQTLDVKNPVRWDIDNPVLYRAVSTVKKDGKVCDIYNTDFGIRTFKFTADDGFWLNGRRVGLKGVDLHHDQGPLGAAFYPRAMERQLEIMKDMGCNAIRTSHNVPAPELLELCDRMGFVVFAEAFDKWDDKADFAEGMDFAEFGRRQMRNFILRDRNHPSVVIWSVGNEMDDIQLDKKGGFEKLKTMVGFVREYDPTRPVTMACNTDGGIAKGNYKYYDVHSWNYGRRYAAAHKAEPNKPALCSESASALSTRGHYELPHPNRKDDFSDSLQISSYDHHAASWAEIPDVDFMWLEQDKFACGEFVWTGFDYLGEPTPYNSDWAKKNNCPEKAAKNSYFGIVDLCGIPKDRFYLYRSHWAQDKTTVHILPHWNWEGWEGKNVPVYVYTNGDSAELFINGKSQGKKSKQPDSDNPMDRYRLRWEDATYQPGQLKAVAYKDGKPIGEAVVKTAGEPAKIKLTADRGIINADGEDLSYVLVELTDKDGVLCPKADNLIRFKVEGSADIAGIGNGNPQSIEPFKADYRRLFYGKAMLIVRSREKHCGKITIRATAEGLPESQIIIESR